MNHFVTILRELRRYAPRYAQNAGLVFSTTNAIRADGSSKVKTEQADLERFERVVIGSVLTDNRKFDEFGLLPTHFFTARRQAMWQTISDLIAKGTEVNAITLFQKTNDGMTLTEIESLPDEWGDPAYAAQKIRDEWMRRRLLLLGKMLIESNSEKDVSEMTDMAFRELYALDGGQGMEIKTVKDMVLPTVNSIEAMYKAGDIPGVPTGYVSLDKKIGGFQKGEFTVLAARTGIGKTEFIVNIIVNQLRQKIVCGVFSAEMAATRIIQRLIFTEAGMCQSLFVHGKATPSDFSMLTDSATELYGREAFLDDTPAIAFSELRSKARRMVNRGAKILYVDYLTLIRYGSKNTPRHERIGELSKEFQRLARELDIPIVVLSQLNRTGEGAQPSLDMLRQSGEIEEDADLILFLHRDRASTTTKLIIAKSRDGASGAVEFQYNPSKSRYLELDKSHD